MSWILAALALALAASPPPGGWPPPPASAGVASVYDGDTLTLATGDKVRLRWVNTPELKPAEPFGPEARAATEAFVGRGTVRLLLGSANPRDGYGRVVAGIETDAGNLSLHLLELGLAHVFVIPPDDTDIAPLLAAQARAKAAGLGIWSTDRYAGDLHITSFHANGRGDDHADPNVEYLRICNISSGPVDLAGWRITRSDGTSYPLPAVTVPAGHTFELKSGVGVDQRDPSAQLEVHLGSATPIWNDDRDRATLLDPRGAVADARDSD